MLTIGRTYAGPKRNTADVCDYCGVTWHRSELTLDANGMLACPDDREGRVSGTLDRLNAAGEPGPILRGKVRR